MKHAPSSHNDWRPLYNVLPHQTNRTPAMQLLVCLQGIIRGGATLLSQTSEVDMKTPEMPRTALLQCTNPLPIGQRRRD